MNLIVNQINYCKPTWAEHFESLRTRGRWERGGRGEGASRPAVKKRAVSQKIFVHFT